MCSDFSKHINTLLYVLHVSSHTYKKKGSTSAAFHSVGVDRNTMVMSAPLVEIMLVVPEFLHSQAVFEISKETLNQYARRITKNATAEVSYAIK